MTNLYADYTVDGYVTLELAQKAEADWQAGVLSLADLVTVINAYENHTKLSNPATQQAPLNRWRSSLIGCGGLFYH